MVQLFLSPDHVVKTMTHYERKEAATTHSFTESQRQFVTIESMWRHTLAFLFHPAPGNYAEITFIMGKMSTRKEPGFPAAASPASAAPTCPTYDSFSRTSAPYITFKMLSAKALFKYH
jgi:hypothetical protein